MQTPSADPPRERTARERTSRERTARERTAHERPTRASFKTRVRAFVERARQRHAEEKNKRKSVFEMAAKQAAIRLAVAYISMKLNL